MIKIKNINLLLFASNPTVFFWTEVWILNNIYRHRFFHSRHFDSSKPSNHYGGSMLSRVLQTSLFPASFSNSSLRDPTENSGETSFQQILSLLWISSPLDAPQNLKKEAPMKPLQVAPFNMRALLRAPSKCPGSSPSLRLSPDTLWRKLILAAYICDLILSLTTQSPWLLVTVGT